MKKDEIDFRRHKAEAKININLWLLGTAFTLFTFVVAINPDLLKENIFLSLQLTLSIPFIMSSVFAWTKLLHVNNNHNIWDVYGFITFIVAYSFLINVVGIFLSTLIDLKIGLVFFLANIVFGVTYSIFEVVGYKEKIRSKILKDSLFIILVLLFGILPAIFQGIF